MKVVNGYLVHGKCPQGSWLLQKLIFSLALIIRRHSCLTTDLLLPQQCQCFGGLGFACLVQLHLPGRRQCLSHRKHWLNKCIKKGGEKNHFIELMKPTQPNRFLPLGEKPKAMRFCKFQQEAIKPSSFNNVDSSLSGNLSISFPNWCFYSQNIFLLHCQEFSQSGTSQFMVCFFLCGWLKKKIHLVILYHSRGPE